MVTIWKNGRKSGRKRTPVLGSYVSGILKKILTPISGKVLIIKLNDKTETKWKSRKEE